VRRPTHFVSGRVFGISEGFRSHLVGRQVNLVDRQLIQNMSLVLVTMSVATCRVRIRTLLLGSLTSFRFRLFLVSASRIVLVLVARFRAVGRFCGIFRSTDSNTLLRNLYLLLHRQRPRHALNVLFPILLVKCTSIPLVLLVRYDGERLQMLYADRRGSGVEVEAEALASVDCDTVAIRIAGPGLGQ
jgi:hypothetical protein